jgi:methionine synthase I (cobalamin-dependent)
MQRFMPAGVAGLYPVSIGGQSGRNERKNEFVKKTDESIMDGKIRELIDQGVIVTDGSWGTQMQARGLKRGENPDSWNIEHSDRVLEVATSYVEAGSQVILTNTFGANRIVLDSFGLADKVVEINTTGVAISRRAAGDKALVFASIGPSGKMLMTGEVTGDELGDAFQEQAEALASAGADALVVETMMDLEELKIAVTQARRTGLFVVASMVFDAGKNKDRTMMGITPEQMVEEITATGANAVGANCGQGIDGFIPICERLSAATDLPVWIKPNAGVPELVEGEVVYRETPDDFVSWVPRLVESGARFIGGCCGTDQRYIRAIRKTLDS